MRARERHRCAAATSLSLFQREQFNIRLTLEQRAQVDAIAAEEDTTTTEWARSAILEAVHLHHALTTEERPPVLN